MRLVLLAISLLFYGALYAQDDNVFLKKVYYQGSDSMPYRIVYPSRYNKKKKYPLIVFLHGLGERGTDNKRQLIHGAKMFLSDSVRSRFPAIIVFPQCPESSYWSNMINTGKIRDYSVKRPPTKAMELLIALVNDLQQSNRVKKKQMYIGGLSMGAMGVFEITARQPGLFTAAFPICGGGDTTAATEMKKTAWWIFHGDKDQVVPLKYSTDMAAALQEQGAAVKMTIYPGVGHGSWNNAFAEPGLLPWLFSQKK